jgi:hypothetical protein
LADRQRKTYASRAARSRTTLGPSIVEMVSTDTRQSRFLM